MPGAKRDIVEQCSKGKESIQIVKTATAADLSGSAEVLTAFHCERQCRIRKATLLYEEASSSDTGVSLKIGDEGDDDLFYTGTSEVSKDQLYTADVTLLTDTLDSGDSVLFKSAGSKSGSGTVSLILEIVVDTAP